MIAKPKLRMAGRVFLSASLLLGALACGSPATVDEGASGGKSGEESTGGSASAVSGGAANSGGSASGGTANGGEATGTGSSNSSGGGSSAGGSGGSWGTDPTKIYESAKLDILFVIDDSSSMLDKQYYLGKAVPGLLLEHLANPPCVTPASAIVQEEAGNCPVGSTRAHAPVTDVHLGVITTSLGSLGSKTCTERDDRARLLPVARPGLGLPSDDPLGFLKFQAGGSLSDVSYHLQAQIAAADAQGCGYEQPLEAIYRFLVAPNPGLTYTKTGSQLEETGTDTQVLEQRAAFLRPDSAVLVVLLSDEDDCSTMAGDAYYANATSAWVSLDPSVPMRSGSAACDTDPNDPCCYSCFQSSPPLGCESTCPADPLLTASEDVANLRCFNQKRRFGIEFTYPTSRYVDAFTKSEIRDTRDSSCVPGSCTPVENPLFAEVAGKRRDPSMVLLLGIVGVPWQDVATPESLDGGALTFMTPGELQAANRWKVILGDPAKGLPPTDPFMIQSVEERSGKNPITSDAIVPSSSTNPKANAINGHESKQNGATFKSLQTACIFELPAPLASCSDPSCDCNPEAAPANAAVCQPPAGGAAGTVQYFAQAFPASRILEVLKGIGESGLVTSICPKNPSGSQSDADYGYNPAMNAAHRALWRALK